MQACFAGGCFWCMTPIFKLWGVDKVTCGYSGGWDDNPFYQSVKRQETGHRESILLEYDPAVVSYEDLLDIYFANVDPYDEGGQFIDRGFSYTLAIFYQTEEERMAAAERLFLLYQETGRQPAVALEPFRSFYPAEEEHQDYYLKNPEAFARELETSGRRPKAEDGGGEEP